MRNAHWFPVLSLLLMSCAAAAADRVVLKNGDRLTGTITKSNPKTLTMQSEYAGIVTIPMDAVVSISADQPLHVTTKEGQTLVGSLTGDAEKLEIRTEDTGTISVIKESVVSVMSKSEYAAWEKLQHPGLGQLWNGAIDAGLTSTRGNARTSSFTLAMNAARATRRDKISLYATSVYARNSSAGKSLVAANTKRGGGRYDINMNGRSFGFGFSDLEADDFQLLDLRVNAGGGFGWHAIRGERLTFDFLGGGSMKKEYFATGLRRTSGDLVAGNELTYKLGSRTMFREKLVYFPNMSELGEYRLAFDASLAATLSRWLSWQMSASDRYLSNPLAGTKANDLILSTGLRVTFAR